MEKEWAEKWVIALRSGKYQQEKGRLRSADGTRHCCLGVLCDLIDPQGWVGIYHKLGYNAILGKAAEIVRMRSYKGDLPNSHNLMYLNDGGISFAKIADLIEEYWEEL